MLSKYKTENIISFKHKNVTVLLKQSMDHLIIQPLLLTF